MKRYIYILALLGCALLPFSCSKEEQQPEEPEFHYNDAKFLLDQLVVSQDDGTFEPLMGVFTHKDSLELSVELPSGTGAMEFFRSLAHRDANLVEQGFSIIWNMTDPEGKSQGKVVLSPVSGKPGVLGVISLEDLTENHTPIQSVYLMAEGELPLPNISRELIEELADHYYYGSVVRIENYGRGPGTFVVIREFEEKGWVPGIALYLDKTDYNFLLDSMVYLYSNIRISRNLAELVTIGKILNKDPDMLKRLLAIAGSGISWNYRYITSETYWTSASIGYYLDNGEESAIYGFQPSYHVAKAYFFKPACHPFDHSLERIYFY